jgi:phenol 2-monooxygenase
VNLNDVPRVFKPLLQPFGLTDLEKVYAAGTVAGSTHDIFDERGISRAGAIVVVRPDQYVANVLPLTATEELAAFFTGLTSAAAARVPA